MADEPELEAVQRSYTSNTDVSGENQINYGDGSSRPNTNTFLDPAHATSVRTGPEVASVDKPPPRRARSLRVLQGI